MQTRSIAAAVLFVFCWGGGPLLSAQQAGSEQTPTFRSSVELVTVDVNVVDRQGQPLRGLQPSDFVVTVGGQARRVVTAEFVDVAASQVQMAARAEDVPVSTNEGASVGRQFVFVVDQSTLETGKTQQVVRAASHFFSRLTFADRSALMLMPVGPNVDFTWSHERVREGLLRAAGSSMPMGTWEYGSLSEARDIANRNMFALGTVGGRECGSGSGLAGLGGGDFGPTGPVAGGAPSEPGPTPPTGAGAPGAGESGGETRVGGGTGGGGSGRGGGRSRASGGGFGMDSCVRDVQMQAESAWQWAQMTSLSSLAALRQILGALGRVRGDKTVILISGGWPLDEREETSALAVVADEAAAARVTLFTLFVPATTFGADRRAMSFTPSRDEYLHSGPLDTLAGMTGGGAFRAEGNAEAAFERLGRELAGYYRIGVEKEPSDQAAKTRRMKVQVSRDGLTVRARGVFDVRTYEDRDWAARLASALESPVPATAVGLRVTSYLAPDPEDRARLKIVLAGEASRIEPGETTFQVIVRDLDGKKVLSGEQPLSDATANGLQFSTNMPVPPGNYIVRIGIMDSAGRVGSVEHRVEAQRVRVGTLSATGPVLVRVPGKTEGEPRFALNSVRQDERLALEISLDGDSAQIAGADVVFEIAKSTDSPPLVSALASLSRGPEGSVLAHAVADMRVLPPGDYVARAKVTTGSETLGELRRGFAVTGRPVMPGAPASVTTTGVVRRAPPPLSARAVGAVQPFALDHVLAPQVLDGFLDRVAARQDAASPMIKELVERARTAGIAELLVSDTLAAESPVAAFLRGLTLFSQKKFDPAANAFRSAMRASPDFFPAMVYLGACYAAGGKDKEAAGAWRTALIKEGDAVALHKLLTDALLRQGIGDLALQTVERARVKWPDDDGLTRRFVVAALLGGKPVEGLQALDTLGDKDEPSMVLALLVLYEAFVNERPVESADQDRARMLRLADAYRARGGPSLALIETWLAAATQKN